MKYGFVFPFGDAAVAAEFAHLAEEAGWDGFFLGDSVWGIDPWVSLAAVAMRTTRLRIGTMITPVSRRRPWKLASESATVDRLSGGRLTLSVGLGALDTGFEAFGEETDRRTRAELLDEGLDIVTGLWRGQPFSYEGKHYRVKENDFFPPPPPIQQPRIPIWVVGAWPRMRSMRRALRYDGLLPNKLNERGEHEIVTPEDIGTIREFIVQERGPDGAFEIVMEGETPGDDREQAAAIVRPFAEAGATWWLDSMWTTPDLDRVQARIRQGPPRIE